jgi:hypothetical protein
VKTYPCGCTAFPNSVPDYCPEHGEPPKATLKDLTDAQAKRLLRYMDAVQSLSTKTPKELVDLMLAQMNEIPLSLTQEFLIEELCTRVYPQWLDEANPCTADTTAGGRDE